MPLDKRALRNISYGLYLVTSHDGDKLNGQVANAVFQVAAEPPLVAVVINKNNLTHKFITNSRVFAVSVLEESTPMEFIGLFGFKSGREIDKLSQCNYKIGATGSPVVVDNALSYFECEVLSGSDAATHTIFIGKVISAEVLKESVPLTYETYHTKKKGKEPRNAPTFQGENKETKKEGDIMKKYVCQVCGYIYNPADGDPEGGIPPGTPFEKLPDTWSCPVCGAGKDEFELAD